MQRSVPQHEGSLNHETRRDFLTLSTTALGVTGAALAFVPFLDSMNPAADTKALSITEVDLDPINVGRRITVAWRGKPIFIDHRSVEQIARAQMEDGANLIDPEDDADRVLKEQWLIVVGVCTHLGCIPVGQHRGESRGDFAGWYCPCHGSHYDTSGRIRKGPAPKNLIVPPYSFTSENTIRIG
ncbi:MAG: ubiquinol-cytochrome c reductase iron-sulfur subunit [Alphaproteobacteria bacterium]|nr:ubiquinol-cytochrome c reductase iron-sulfur subunit [Alphaproteobacteria bacterium]